MILLRLPGSRNSSGSPGADAVDPTGAGDAFRGGLIKGIVDGLSMERAVQMGNVAGHYAVRKWGTQQYSFTIEEFKLSWIRISAHRPGLSSDCLVTGCRIQSSRPKIQRRPSVI
ncbi:MAG: hypothetical protein CM1200mP22_33940 [Dehalococcoidia bacterium]|nr:MAG: hypothetical protein CM1200mP22_33940 [Dehalococcoidia bacterium]